MVCRAMTVLPYWIQSRLPEYRRQQEEQILEEQRKIKEKASRYDTLINTPGYQDILLVMKSMVDLEIIEATKISMPVVDPMDPERQRIRIIRWNAMREILDGVIHDIEFIRTERDRINREEEDFLRESMKPQTEKVNTVSEI